MSGPFDPAAATLSPKLLKAFSTPAALLTIVHDAPRRRLLAAGLDGALYQVDLRQLDPPVGENPPANDDSTARQKANDGAKDGANAKPSAPDAPRPAAERRFLMHDNFVSSLTLVGDRLVSAGYDRTIAWWNVDSGELLRRTTAHDGWVRKIAVVAAGARLASVGDDLRVRVWDATTDAPPVELGAHERLTPQGFANAVYALAVHPDGRRLATADRTGVCHVWDLETRRSLARFDAPEFYTFDAAKRARSIGGVRSLAFTPDGRGLALSGIGQVTNVDGFVGPCRVELWDWEARRREFVGQGRHQAVLNHVDAGQTPWLIAAGGGDGGAAIVGWNRSTSEPQTLAKPSGHLHQFAVDASAGRLYAAGHDGLQIWQF